MNEIFRDTGTLILSPIFLGVWDRLTTPGQEAFLFCFFPGGSHGKIGRRCEVSDTIDGRNPTKHLGCIKPCK